MNKAEEILKAFDRVKSDRQVVEDSWADFAYFGFPRKRAVNYFKMEGEKQPRDVYDDTAIQSNLILAAGLSGYMTNSAQRWFELRSRDPELMNDNEVRKFFADSADVMYSTYANTNFYQQIHEMYLDMGIFGSGILYSEDDAQDEIRFFARNPKEIFYVENDRETVDVIFRYVEMKAYAAYTFFGADKCGEQIKKCVEEQKDYNKTFNFVHHVCPRTLRVAGKNDATNKPFASYWVSCADRKVLKEGGYDEFPFIVPRFYKTTGETYGDGPMGSTYSNVWMINRMVELYYKGGELALWPAWLVEHDSMLGTLDLRSGRMNYQRAPLREGAQVQPLNAKSQFEIGIDFINRVEEKIKRAFFVDLFLMMSQLADNKTATEVIERSQERMLILGPVLGRMQSEGLNQLIYRNFNQLARRGKLPPIPEQLAGKSYDVVYISPLAKAQRALQAKDMTTYLTIIGQMAQMFPEILDNINADIVADKMSKIFSVDPDIIRDEEEVGGIREARAQQQQAMQQMAALQGAADIAKTGSEAGKAARDASEPFRQ